MPKNSPFNSTAYANSNTDHRHSLATPVRRSPHPAAFYLSLRCHWPYKTIQFTPDDDSTSVQTWGQSMDGSTFALTRTHGITQVAAVGPPWNEIEAAYTEWHELGRPERDRFGVSAGKQQWVWLDKPDHVITELRVPVTTEPPADERK